jgi:hypothetical protein
VLAFVTLAIAGAVGIIRLQSIADLSTAYPIHLYHKVLVLARNGQNRFRLLQQDPDNKEWNEYSWVGCDDYPITKEIQAGVVLCVWKYEERPGCMSVAKHNLGYTLWRDDHDKPILATLSGQTSWCSPQARSETETSSASARSRTVR